MLDETAAVVGAVGAAGATAAAGGAATADGGSAAGAAGDAAADVSLLTVTMLRFCIVAAGTPLVGGSVRRGIGVSEIASAA